MKSKAAKMNYIVDLTREGDAVFVTLLIKKILNRNMQATLVDIPEPFVTRKAAGGKTSMPMPG